MPCNVQIAHSISDKSHSPTYHLESPACHCPYCKSVTANIFYSHTRCTEPKLIFLQHHCHAVTQRILSHLLQETMKRSFNHERDLVAVLTVNALNTARALILSERFAIILAAKWINGVLKGEIGCDEAAGKGFTCQEGG